MKELSAKSSRFLSRSGETFLSFTYVYFVPFRSTLVQFVQRPFSAERRLKQGRKKK